LLKFAALYQLLSNIKCVYITDRIPDSLPRLKCENLHHIRQPVARTEPVVNCRENDAAWARSSYATSKNALRPTCRKRFLADGVIVETEIPDDLVEDRGIEGEPCYGMFDEIAAQ